MQRFISRKTVDKVLRELREQTRGNSRASSSAGSFTAAQAGGASRGGSFTTATRSG